LKGYDFIHNSKGSSRGVGILFKSTLLYKIHSKTLDFADNYILVDVTIENFRLTIGSVYGPNRDDLEFFDNLKLDVRNVGQNSVILGGDWNCTYDSNPVQINIDVLNMANIPSKRRSLKIASIAHILNLTDPYRFFNPEKREFTFIPNILNNRNRSRLDFFLISEILIPFCKNSTIPHSLSSKLLDHKQVCLCFKSKRKINPQKINDRILKDETLEYSLLLHAFDTYVNHANIGINFTANEKANLSNRIGVLMNTSKRIQTLKLSGEQNGNIPVIAGEVAALTEELTTGIEQLPQIEYFENLELTCNPDVFFETFAFTLKNATLSFQSSFFKIKNHQKTRLKAEIKTLKMDYVNNCNLIFEKETQLSNIVDLELREELSMIKNFERLNDEKITPYFLNLAKTPVKTDTLDIISDDNSQPFDNSDLRNSHIHRYYQDLYKKPLQNNVGRNDFSIEDFLGDCANHPDILSSKLNEEEKNLLDRPFGIEELDLAVKKIKINSAPGGDGISNRFISKNWNLFRVPLFKYAIKCFDKGVKAVK